MKYFLAILIFLLYTTQLSAQDISVYYVGHSLVNLDMPYQVDQMSDQLSQDMKYRHHINIGAPIQLNWQDTLYNPNPMWDATTGVTTDFGTNHLTELTNSYDHIIVTEAVPLMNYVRDTTVHYAANFVNLAKQANSNLTAYVYATWEGDAATGATWRAGLTPLQAQWEDIATQLETATGVTTHILPGNLMMMRLYDSLQSASIGSYSSITDFFQPDGLHLNDDGNFIIATLISTILQNQSMAGHGIVEAGPYSLNFAMNDSIARSAIQVMAAEVACDYTTYTGYTGSGCGSALSLDESEENSYLQDATQQALSPTEILPFTQVEVYNLLGQRVFQRKAQPHTYHLETADLSTGYYIIRQNHARRGAQSHKIYVQ